MKTLAQSLNINGQSLSGPIDIPGVSSQNITIGVIVNRVVQFVIPLGAIILLFVLIWGGYDFLMSQGNPEKVKSARAKITTGIIGFLLLVFAFLIVRIIAFIFKLQGGIL